MPTVIPVVIDDSVDKTITGQISYDRASGGTLLVPSAASHPSSPVAREIYWNTTQRTFYRRDDTNAEWEEIIQHNRNQVVGIYDFLSRTLDTTIWDYAVSYSTLALATDKHYGECVFEGSVSGGWAFLVFRGGSSAYCNVNNNLELSWRAKALNDAYSEVVFGPSYDGSNNIIFYKSGTGNWRARTMGSGSSSGTDTDTGVAQDDAYHIFKIVATSSSIKFYIDTVLVATHSTNIPTVDMRIEHKLTLLSANQSYFYMDWFEYICDR